MTNLAPNESNETKLCITKLSCRDFTYASKKGSITISFTRKMLVHIKKMIGKPIFRKYVNSMWLTVAIFKMTVDPCL